MSEKSSTREWCDQVQAALDEITDPLRPLRELPAMPSGRDDAEELAALLELWQSRIGSIEHGVARIDNEAYRAIRSQQKLRKALTGVFASVENRIGDVLDRNGSQPPFVTPKDFQQLVVRKPQHEASQRFVAGVVDSIRPGQSREWLLNSLTTYKSSDGGIVLFQAGEHVENLRRFYRIDEMNALTEPFERERATCEAEHKRHIEEQRERDDRRFRESSEGRRARLESLEHEMAQLKVSTETKVD